MAFPSSWLVYLSLLVGDGSAGVDGGELAAILSASPPPSPATLVALGEEVVPQLVEVVALGTFAAEHRLDDSARAAARSGLHGFGLEPIARWSDGADQPAWPVPVRTTVVQLFGELGGERDLPRLIRLAARSAQAPGTMGGADPRDPVLLALGEAVEEILAREPRGYPTIAYGLSEVERELRPALLRALVGRGRSGDRAALEALGDALSERGEQHGEVLRAIEVVARSHEPPHEEHMLSLVRENLTSEDEALRRDAARAVGSLGDPAAAQALVHALSDSDRGVRDAAHRSLQRLSSLRLPAIPARWSAWWERERRWWDEDYPELRDLVRTADPALVPGAINALVLHPLYRAEIYLDIAPLLGHSNPGLRAVATSALRQLGFDPAGDSDSRHSRALAR